MRRQTRRHVALGLPALAATMAAPWEARASEGRVAFLVVGDWGRDGASHQRDVATQMGRAAAQIDARFVVSVGDNFYDNGVQSTTDPQWRTSFEDVYVAQSLQKPWYVTLGNHDYHGSPQAQIDYAATSDRWRMPTRYYKVSGAEFGAPEADLFVIDTSPIVQRYRSGLHSALAQNVQSQDVDTQLAWLDAELGRSQAQWKLVFGHHTIFSGGSAHGNTPELVAQVKPLLERHGVQTYVNGHEHDLQHIQVGAVNYVCSGAGSEVRPTGETEGTRFALARSGFAAITIRASALDLEFRDYTGRSVYQASVNA
jgi:tartrate-resistant acid phosphatase type 5